MERFVCGQRAGQVIVWNIELGRFAVDEQTCAGGFLGSIVGECYVMPLVGRDGLMGADFDRVAGPLIDKMDFDRLVVDVETKSSMKPRDAVASAGRTLVELFGLARELNLDAEGIEMGPSVMDAALAADLALPIEDLDLTVRSYNCLKREGIHTVGELVGRSEADLLDIRNFGSKSIDEVKAKLVSMGMSLKDSPAGFDPTQHQNYNAAVDDDFVDADQA